MSVVALVGPTASGKTDLALRVAERLPIEVVSLDSAQVYRGMDIGTAKPDAATCARLPHHLLDLCEPTERYSAARFVRDAKAAIGDIRGRGSIPMIVGGTMLYLRALEHGLSDMPPTDAAVREEIAREADEHGWPTMHRRLAALDPFTAQRLHPNDSQRIGRALEVARSSGDALSTQHAAGRVGALDEPLIKFAVDPGPREQMWQRIAIRFNRMLADGLVDEVSTLRSRPGMHRDLPSMRSVGYRQVWAHLDGEFDADALSERGAIATRQFAKRQLTWMRSETGLKWVSPSDPAPLEAALRGA